MLPGYKVHRDATGILHTLRGSGKPMTFTYW